MVRNGFIAILFLLSAMLQMSLVYSFSYPLVLIPLHFLIGILVFHRANVEIGATWFILSSFFLSFVGFDPMLWWTYIVIALFGIFLMKKLFTTRSLYALEGFGISMFTVFSILNTVPRWIQAAWQNQPIVGIETPMKDYFIALAFLIIGLYIGFLFSRFIERLASEMLFIKK